MSDFKYLMFIYLFNNVLPNVISIYKKNQGQNKKVPEKRATLNILYKQCQLNSIQIL